jgi:hypothetical protein
VEDPSAPIPEEMTSELGRIIEARSWKYPGHPPPALRVKKPHAIVVSKFSRESLKIAFHV